MSNQPSREREQPESLARWDNRMVQLLTPRWSLAPVWRYGLAVLFAVAATALRWALIPWLGLVAPYNIALLAVFTATVLLGIGPGLLSLLLADLAVEWFILGSAPMLLTGTALARLGLNLAIGIFICSVIHALRVAHTKARASEARYRSLFENMLDGYAYCRVLYEDGAPQDFIYLSVNDAFEGLTGLKNVVGKKVSEVIPGLRAANPEALEICGRVALSGKPERFETYINALDIWLSISVYSPAKERFVAVFDNITARKQVEGALLEAERARVRMAHTLTSEIAHRTKNNLAIVAGLLQLQSNRITDPETYTDLMHDAVTRIMAFAALHEQMYQRHSESVELLDALRRIAEVARQALSDGEVTISVEGASAECPSGIATNFCVIANELITNAIKHGGSQQGIRRVEVHLARERGSLKLSVWNSGNPVSSNFDLKERAKTGLGLVSAITEDQYGGSFTLTPERGGTAARIVLEEEILLKQ